MTKTAPIPNLMDRLKNWWDGADFPIEEAHGHAGPAQLGTKVEDVFPEWETPWVRVMQALWGEGMDHPGGADNWLRLVTPCALNPAMNLAVIGVGLGGGMRAIANKFNMWVSGYELNGELASAGRMLAQKAGMLKRAPIFDLDPVNFAVKAGSLDCVFCYDVLGRLTPLEPFLAKIARDLKPYGQLLISEWTSPKDNGTPQTRPVEEYISVLGHLGFDIRICDDESELYFELIIDGFMDLMNNPSRLAVGKSCPDIFWKEMENWARRATAIRAKQMGCYRIYAQKTSPMHGHNKL